jgi:putative transport protein
MSLGDTLLAFLSRQDILLLFLLVGTGAIVGRVRLGGVELGAAAVLFIGMALSALGESRGHRLVVPEAFGTLGLVLFTFSVGIMSGAAFFASIRRDLRLVAATVAILIAAAVLAVAVGHLLGLPGATVAGSYTGALTNTPALAAAREAAQDDAAPTIAYAVTYLFGVVGPLLAVSLALRGRSADKDLPPTLTSRSIAVDQPSAPTFGELERRFEQRIRFSRHQSGPSESDARTPGHDARPDPGDIVTVVGPADLVDEVTRLLGRVSVQSLEASRSTLDFRRITLSDEDLAGRTIAELDLFDRFGAKVIRVRRGDVDVLASDDFVLQPGDRLRIIAPRADMAAVTAFLGDSERGLSDIHPIVLGTGMVLGLLLGGIEFPLPGANFSIGPAAGTLLVGLVFGALGRIGPFLTTLPHAAGQAMADFGLLAFLAQAGTRAGTQLESALTSGETLRIVLLGVLITSFVSASLFVLMRRRFGIGRTRLAGMMAGAHTQPAVLAFANERTKYDSRVIQGYALVYPAALIAKILIARVLGAL